MVDGTGLENQQINVSQVRILSLPPKNERKRACSLILFLKEGILDKYPVPSAKNELNNTRVYSRIF